MQVVTDLDKVDINEDNVIMTIQEMHKSQLVHEAAQKCLDIYKGGNGEVQSIIKLLQQEDNIGDSITEVTKDLDELLKEMDYSNLFTFNAPSQLNDCVKGVGKGHFTIIFARPESGKTAFWINMVAGPNGFAYQEKVNNIAVFCNEEKPTRNVFRLIQSCSDMTRTHIDAEPTLANEEWKKIRDKIHVYDCKDFTVESIDSYCEEYKPDIVVIDQLDKVELSGSFNSGHEKLREIYKLTRDISSRRDVCMFGICQASSDAHDKNHISFDTMEGSKTGKAAEADLIIGIGKKDDWEGKEDFTRTLCISKNKLTGWHGIIVCKIVPSKSRYID
jgi:KaiC/GvpD/RAD55 family RecA-like ATPase